MADSKFTFEQAMKEGIYYDRCIDLYAFDSNMKLLWTLTTPQTGYKPDITIKGTLIGGTQAISTFISVTNLAYNAEINNVDYIMARMYYKGLENKVVGDFSNYKGHTILYSVLYADQEKEPPNRAIRFQCTVAATDYTRMGANLYVNSDGKFTQEKVEDNGTNADGEKKEMLKSMKEILLEVAKYYNLNLSSEFKKDGEKTKDLQIHKVVFDCEAHEKIKIAMSNYDGTIGGMLKRVNASTVNINGQSMNVWNVTLYDNTLRVGIVYPSDTKLLENPFFKRRDAGGEYTVIESQTKVVGNTKSSLKAKVVELFYVNSSYASGASRAEVLISANTLFDDRIYPGCLCAVMGNTIMGRNKKRSVQKEGSSLVKYTDEVVVFEAVGKIDFEFSTTQKSYMAIQGPVLLDSDWNAYQQWKRK